MLIGVKPHFTSVIVLSISFNRALGLAAVKEYPDRWNFLMENSCCVWGSDQTNSLCHHIP